MTADRRRLRTTSDSAAQLYQQARPEYPDELYDEVIRLADLRPGAQLVEVGCATGKATAPLARRGFRITCVEIGAELAKAAEQYLAVFPDVEVVQAAFETWRPTAEIRFDLVFATTAWHWIDPATRYRRAWELLRPGGYLALWTAVHVFPVGGDSFFEDIQPVYDAIGEGMPAGAARYQPGELPDDRSEIEGSRPFEDLAIRRFDWEIIYHADQYIRLLDTFSGHIAMDQWKRDWLYGEIRRRLAERPDRNLRRHWGAVLQVARRASGAAELAGGRDGNRQCSARSG